MEIDRRHFIAALGGAAAVKLMSHEARAEALEAYMMQELNTQAAKKFPKAADIEAQIGTRSYRRGVGNLFLTTQPNAKVRKLDPMPAKPTFLDFFKNRFGQTSNHVLQSANRAMKTGMTEEIIMACLLHDTVHALIKTDHGYWGAQMYAAYVSEKVAFPIPYHLALRFYYDKEASTNYPDVVNGRINEPFGFAHYGNLRNSRLSPFIRKRTSTQTARCVDPER